MSSPITPLVHDPAREAAAVAGGFFYQILQSVSAWIALRDGEILFLEGAEDFDRVAEGHATTAQIKHTRASGNITLRSSNVLQAINHFWRHASENAGRTVCYRYITTSSVGLEKGDPISRGLPGIDVWRRAKRSDDPLRQGEDLDALKRFLLGQDALSDPLRDFLARCTREEFATRLIQPIDWDTAAAETEEILASIRDDLVLLGEKRSIPSYDAEQAIGDLHLHAWQIATEGSYENRRLTRPDLLRIFDRATQMLVPKSKVIGEIGKQDLDSLHFVRVPSATKLPFGLRVTDPIVDRDTEVKTLQLLAQPNRLIPIVGPSWSGKSTIVRKFVATIVGGERCEINGKPLSLLYINLANQRPLRAFRDAFRSSRDMPMASMDYVASDNDDETDSDSTRMRAGDIIEHILPSHLHDRHLVAVFANYSDLPTGEPAVRELGEILNSDLFRLSTTLLETEDLKLPTCQRIVTPAIVVQPFGPDHAVELLAAWHHSKDVALAAIKHFEADPDMLFPGILVKGAARYSPALDLAGHGVSADKLAEAFLDEASQIVEKVLLDLGCSTAAGALTPMDIIQAMAVMTELPVTTAILDRAGLPLPPFARLRQLRWIEGEDHFQLAGLARQGLRAVAKARLQEGGEGQVSLAACIIRLCEACRDEGALDGRYQQAIEETTRWLLQRLPDQRQLLRFFVAEAIQVTASDDIPIFFPEEEEKLLPGLEHEAEAGNFDAALASLTLSLRSPVMRQPARREADRERFLSQIKRVVDLAAKMPSIRLEHLRLLDIALYQGARRLNRRRDILELRTTLQATLERQIATAGYADQSWRWWLSWLLNTADLCIGTGQREQASQLLTTVRNGLRALIVLRKRTFGSSWIWWLRARFNLLEQRLTADPQRRLQLVRQASSRAARCLSSFPTEPRWIRFYLRTVRRLIREVAGDDARKAAVDRAIETLTFLFGPPPDWSVDVRAQMAALVRDEARRAWNVDYQHTRGMEALALLRSSARGNGDDEISSNDRAGLVEARVLSFLELLPEAEARCDRILRSNPSGPAWELKLRIVDRRSSSPLQGSTVLDMFELRGGAIPPVVQRSIRQFKDWLDESNAGDLSSAKALLWSNRRQWSSEGAIEAQAARLARDEGIDFWRLSHANRQNRFLDVYKLRMATLRTCERRFGPFRELIMAQVQNEAQYQRSLAVLLKQPRDNEPVIKIFERGLQLWPGNEYLSFELACFYRYVWMFSSAIDLFRKLRDTVTNGELRRQVSIALAECLYNLGANHAALAEIGRQPEIDRLDALNEAKDIVASLLGHSEIASEVAMLRDHIALELGEEVNWDEVDRLFELLVREVNGFPNAMIQNIDELRAPEISEIPDQLYKVVREELADPQTLGSMGLLYLRRAESGKSIEPLRDAERAYALFNACSVLERSWHNNEFILTSVRRGRAILFAADFKQSLNPFEKAPSESKRSQLDLARGRLQSAADRSVIEFRTMIGRHLKQLGNLEKKLSAAD
jgi:hypothetical protein